MADNSPNNLDTGETFLCPKHSRRVTQPNCEDCANEKRHTQTERRVAENEQRISELESRLAELEAEAGEAGP